jgi:hypothetical protein
MTHDQALWLYRPIRAAIRRILGVAIRVCSQSDVMRVAKALGLRVDGKVVLPEYDKAAEMLSDVALFEPNQRGRRAFDVFLSGKALQLDAADFELVQRMGNAFFSLFRCTARHEVAGVCLEDLLDGDRKIWLMDESMESSASTNGAFGMRVFDAGDFHVGFGIAVPSDDETTEFSVQVMTRNGRTPFRHSLAVTLYGDSLIGRAPPTPQAEDAHTSLLSKLIEPHPTGPRKPEKGRARRKRWAEGGR